MRNLQVKFIATIIFLLFNTIHCKAQTQEDVNVSEGGYGLIKTNMNMAYDHGWGVLKDGFAARVSYEFLRKGKFTVSANARYSSTELGFSDFDLLGKPEGLPKYVNPNDIHINGTHILAQFGFTSTFKTSLFHRPFLAMAMVTSEWGQYGFDRVSGIAMGLFMLRYNRNTQFGIGPLVMVNTCSKLPAFLVFMYSHRFSEKWKILLYGGIFDVEFNPTKNDLICLGADVDVKAFYFKPEVNYLPGKCRFTSTSFRPLLKYKRRLIPNLYFEVMGGVTMKMSSRVNGVTGSKEWIDCTQKIAPFLQAAVSYGL